VSLKFNSVVKVCAGKVTAVAAQRAITVYSLFDALAICFIDVLLGREDYTAEAAVCERYCAANKTAFRTL
jgi:hypothetical protein